MKFTLSILALLAIVFLVGCSAKDTGNKSELNNKYGGIYIFDRKLYNEVIEKERIRDMEIKKIWGKIFTAYDSGRVSKKDFIIDNDIRNKKEYQTEDALWNQPYFRNSKELQSNLEIIFKTIPRTLSNGKMYYINARSYQILFNKQPKVPEIYKERIRNLIGKENLDKIPGIGLGSFYSDEEGNITPITMYIQYSDKVKSYGLFGDEGRGFSLSRDRFEYYEVKNKFYMEDLEK